jgi:hypothetical protein
MEITGIIQTIEQPVRTGNNEKQIFTIDSKEFLLFNRSDLLKSFSIGDKVKVLYNQKEYDSKPIRYVNKITFALQSQSKGEGNKQQSQSGGIKQSQSNPTYFPPPPQTKEVITETKIVTERIEGKTFDIFTLICDNGDAINLSNVKVDQQSENSLTLSGCNLYKLQERIESLIKIQETGELPF